MKKETIREVMDILAMTVLLVVGIAALTNGHFYEGMILFGIVSIRAKQP